MYVFLTSVWNMMTNEDDWEKFFLNLSVLTKGGTTPSVPRASWATRPRSSCGCGRRASLSSRRPESTPPRLTRRTAARRPRTALRKAREIWKTEAAATAARLWTWSASRCRSYRPRCSTSTWARAPAPTTPRTQKRRKAAAPSCESSFNVLPERRVRDLICQRKTNEKKCVVIALIKENFSSCEWNVPLIKKCFPRGSASV